MPPVKLLREHGCKITLGTDSYASNEALSIVREMQLLQEKIPDIPLVEILGWATINGAEALGFDGLGCFDAGFKPGLVQLNVEESGKLTRKINRLL